MQTASQSNEEMNGDDDGRYAIWKTFQCQSLPQLPVLSALGNCEASKLSTWQAEAIISLIDLVLLEVGN